MEDIRVERGAEVRPGVFAWHIPSLGLSGESREPLLDACKQIQSLPGNTRRYAALFRPGRPKWDIRCSIEWGSKFHVRADGPRFVRADTERFAALREAAQ